MTISTTVQIKLRIAKNQPSSNPGTIDFDRPAEEAAMKKYHAAGQKFTVHKIDTRNRPVDFVTTSFTTSYNRSSDKTEFCLMIDCNWSWNLQLQSPLVCFSWLHQLHPVSQLGVEHCSWGGLSGSPQNKHWRKWQRKIMKQSNLLHPSVRCSRP